MRKTKIEWCDYSINPIKGLCKEGCEYCYARRMYKRFKWDETVRLDLSVFKKLSDTISKREKEKEQIKIFVCSTHELFGSWIPDDWISRIMDNIKHFPHPNCIFLILTKNPERMQYWSYKNGMPNNVWCGVTAETTEKIIKRLSYIWEVDAKILFLSIEPILERIRTNIINMLLFRVIVDWIIVGAETGNRKNKVIPKREWIEEIVSQAENLGIPIFLKNNLKKIWGDDLMQQFPNEKKKS